MRLFSLLRFFSSGPRRMESPPVIPAQSPPSGIVTISLGELREELKLRVVVTELRAGRC